MDTELAFLILEEVGLSPSDLARRVPPEHRDAVEQLPHRVVQVDVPRGQEAVVIQEVTGRYLERMGQWTSADQAIARFIDPQSTLLIQPELVASAGAPGLPAGTVTLSGDHPAFVQALGPRPTGTTVRRAKVTIIDSGWDTTQVPTNAQLGAQYDVTQSPVAPTAAPFTGHGTGVSKIVDDLVPDAVLSMVCVGDDAPREQFFIAGLLTAFAGDADIINASVGFGMTDALCGFCGRDDPGTVRSLVFERTLANLLDRYDKTVFVAAAGNEGIDPPAFPSAYDGSVCVLSSAGVASGGASGMPLSTFSNHGPVTTGSPTLVVAPGGDTPRGTAGSARAVLTVGGTTYSGTSFAAAYTTSVIADHVCRNGRRLRTDIVADLATSADDALVDGYSASRHGEGGVQWF